MYLEYNIKKMIPYNLFTLQNEKKVMEKEKLAKSHRIL